MGSLFREIESVFFPGQCPVCKEILPVSPGGRVWIHRACFRKLTPVREPVCKKCGKPLTDIRQEYCADCRRVPHSFEYGRSLWRYDRYSGEIIFSYKYGRRQDLAERLGAVAVHELGGWIRSLPVSRIVPVPVSPDRLKRRGFDQSLFLAEQIGCRLGIPVFNVLRRRRDTRPQKELGRAERMRNLASAFYAKPGSCREVGGILLVDDIYTTGSTAELCTRALKAAGAGKVWVFTLCIGEYGGTSINLLDERGQGVI